MSDLTLPEARDGAGTSPFDAIRRVRDDDTEYWSARELMPLLGYDRWENFMSAIERAHTAAHNQGLPRLDLFRGVTKRDPADRNWTTSWSASPAT